MKGEYDGFFPGIVPIRDCLAQDYLVKQATASRQLVEIVDADVGNSESFLLLQNNQILRREATKRFTDRATSDVIPVAEIFDPKPLPGG
jgi:hypothetical protein